MVVRRVVKSVGKGCESLPHTLAVPFADLYQCFDCSINFRVLFRRHIVAASIVIFKVLVQASIELPHLMH